MNIIDFIIIFIILIFMGLGYYRGFFKVVMNLIEYILSIVLAYMFYPTFAQFLCEKFFIDEFMHGAILNAMKSAIENASGNEGLTVPIESLDLPIINDMANMVVMLVSILVLFLVFKLLIKIVSFFIEKLTHLPILKEFNKIGGLVAGFIEGILIVFLCLAVVNCFSNEELDKRMEESLMGDKFSSVVANFTVSLISKL